MNNYSNTEKSLKRWLKSRVKITMATVVGFLIAGTAAFGMTEIPEQADIAIKAGQVSDGQGKYQVTVGKEIKDEVQTSFYGTKAMYEGLGISLEGNEDEGFIVNKNIVIDGSEVKKGQIAPSAISAGDTSSKKMINKGNIWVKAGTGYVEAMGTQGAEGTIINEGNIYVVDGSMTKAKGMGVNPGGTAINKGLIIVNNGSGMIDNSGSINKTMLNDVNGKIVVEGTGAGINHRKEALAEGRVENKGTIEVIGKGTGVLIANDKNQEDYSGKIFTNSGKILANNGGKAIFSLSKDFTLNLNKGSHIEGIINLAGANNTVNIDGVGITDKAETNNIVSNDVNVKINNSNIILEGNLKNADDTVVELNNKDGNNTLVNNATIEGAVGIAVANAGCDTSVTAKDRLVSITNNGNITASEYGIYNNGYYTKHNKIEINNAGNILVNNFVKTSSGNKPYYYNNGIYSASAPYTETAGIVKNTKEVKIDLTAEQSAELKTKYTETAGDMYLNIHGIRLHEHTEGYNTGDVIVNSFGGVGVALTAGDTGANSKEEFKERYGYFENNGNITVTGENTKGIQVKNTTEAKLEAVNESNGVITINGTNAVGAEVKGANSHFTNKGTIVLGEEGTGKKAITLLDGGNAINLGKIQIKGTELDGIKTREEAIDTLFGENFADENHKGLITDKNDNALFLDEDTTITEDTTTEILDGLAQGNGSVGVDGDLTITGTGDNTVESESFNVTGGTATIKGEVIIASDKINLDGEGKLAVEDNSSLALENGDIEKTGEGTAIEVDGTLALDNMKVNGDIAGKGTVNITGNGELNGSITGTPENKITINFGTVVKTFALRNARTERAIQELSADGSLSNAIANIGSDMQLGLKVKADGTNMFGNSTGMELTGTGNEDVIIRTENLSGDEIVINLGENKYTNVDMITDSEIYVAGDVIDNETGKDEVTVKYNDKLYSDLDENLREVNKAAKVVNTLFSQDTTERAAQLDKIYSSNIYSETVRAAYDNVKMNEEAVESLARKSEIGKWTAEGKALYSKNEYDRNGIVGDYSSEVESTGLMAAFGYGLNETTTAGVAFSGVKQDVDTDTGSADADLFYLGVYGNKVVGNYDFTAGLGYQFGKYEADNNILGTANDKYDSKSVSGYVQGRYTADLGDGLSVQPKIKLGYTYVEQDDTKDSYFGVEDAEISTFDAEVGFDVVKSVQLEKSKLDVKFGASYIRTMGDTDEEFTGRFYGAKASEGFDVLGAELAENVVKFNLGAEVTSENGFFYNGGLTYEFGSNDTEAYGVTAGVGYKF